MVSENIEKAEQSITDFDHDNIPWAGGKTLYSWWQETRADRPYPNRKDFFPAAAAKLLPAIQLIDVGGPDRLYSVRLAGTAITEILGFDPTGIPLDELPNTETVRTVYDWVVDNKKPLLRLNTPIRWGDKDFISFSVLILPLGPDAEDVSMLLMHFHFNKPHSAFS